MEYTSQDLEFGDFKDLTPEEFAKVSEILHGERNLKESKVEFPWDNSQGTEYMFTTQFGDVTATDIHYVDYPDTGSSYFDQNDHGIDGDGGGQNIVFMGQSEPPYGYSQESVVADNAKEMNQNVQGFYNQNLGIQPNQQTGGGVNYVNEYTPDGDRHVVVPMTVDEVEYRYSYNQPEIISVVSADPHSTQTVNSDSDGQTTQRTYERRNKKKRPPEYYKQLEAEIEAERLAKLSHRQDSDMNWNQQYVQDSHLRRHYANSVPSLPSSDNFVNENIDTTQTYSTFDNTSYSSQPSVGHIEKNSLQNERTVSDSYNREPVQFRSSNQDLQNDLTKWQEQGNIDKKHIYPDVHDDPAVISATTSHQHPVQQAASNSSENFTQYNDNNVISNQFPDRRIQNLADQRTNDFNFLSQDISNVSPQNKSAIENEENQYASNVTYVNLEPSPQINPSVCVHEGHGASQMVLEPSTNFVSKTCDIASGGGSKSNKVCVSVLDNKYESSYPSNETENSDELVSENTSKFTVDNSTSGIAHPTTRYNVDNSTSGVAQPVEIEAPKPKVASWAGLFRDTESAKSAVTIPYYKFQSGEAGQNVSSNQKENEKKMKDIQKTAVEISEDSAANMLGAQLSNMRISHVQNALQPRGLINRGNWCYINATLQALVACPPFVNLMKKLATFKFEQRGTTSTPVLDSLIEFVNEFSGFIRSSKGLQKGRKPYQEIITGSSFEPTRVYKMLEVVKANSSFKHGKQEDAEEFLSCILDGIHEEMSAIINMASGNISAASKPNGYLQEDCSSIASDEQEVTDESWEQVGPKKKSVQTRRADFAKSPMSEIFTGYIRSAVFKKTAKESATLQPFFTLQLDIQSDKVLSVMDALEGLVSKESVDGFTCSQTKEELEIVRKITLEELPPVLILHLKFFVYDKDGGCQKLMKKIDYDIDLEITRDLLSPNVKSKLTYKQRSYKLFAVIYHHGEKSTGGHYTTAVFHSGIMGWINIDDSNIKTIPVGHVLRYSPPRIPYLLYYRRLDV